MAVSSGRGPHRRLRRGPLLKFGLTVSFFAFFAFTAALLVITFIDLDHRIIPDVISIPGIPVGLESLFSCATVVDRVTHRNPGRRGLALPRATVYEASPKGREWRRRREAAGHDRGMAGWKGVLFTLFFASLSGTVMEEGHVGDERGKALRHPFGPFWLSERWPTSSSAPADRLVPEPGKAVRRN